VRLQRETVNQAKQFRAILKDHDDFMIRTLMANSKVLQKAVLEDAGTLAIERNGIGPYLRKPGAIIEREIHEIMQNTGLSREGAISWIRESFDRQGVNGAN